MLQIAQEKLQLEREVTGLEGKDRGPVCAASWLLFFCPQIVNVCSLDDVSITACTELICCMVSEWFLFGTHSM